MLTRFAGASVPAYVKRVVHDRRAAGVTLFTDNARSPAQLRALTREIQAAARGEALVAVDQEGGAASRLPWLHAPGQPTLATPTAAASASRSTARALRGVGVNLNLAPVADVSGGAGGAVAGRSFPGDSRSVAALTAAAVRAYRGTHVAPTPKHFPGFGRATANTDDAKVTIGASRADLAGDLAPFRAGIAAGAPAVMVSHALYPAYDRAWIGSQSRAIVTGVLRGELHFRGVVATDSMEAEAVVGRSSLQDAAVYAIYAGCDLLVLTGRGSQRLVYERLLAEARRSPEFRRRVEESARRVLALKRALGRRTPPAR
jgi:beta-N-acetylhexosaminidase